MYRVEDFMVIEPNGRGSYTFTFPQSGTDDAFTITDCQCEVNFHRGTDRGIKLGIHLVPEPRYLPPKVDLPPKVEDDSFAIGSAASKRVNPPGTKAFLRGEAVTILAEAGARTYYVKGHHDYRIVETEALHIVLGDGYGCFDCGSRSALAHSTRVLCLHLH